MAILKIARNSGKIFEIPISIDKCGAMPKKEQVGSYSINNGLITQTMLINMSIGVRCIYFPMTYSTVCHGVFLEDVTDDMRDKIIITDTQLDHFILNIHAHTHDINEVFGITSTGY